MAPEYVTSKPPVDGKEIVNEEIAQQLDAAYPAFARRDIYGRQGLGPLSVGMQLYLWIASFTLFPLRAIVCLLFFAVFYFICVLATAFQQPTKYKGQDVGTYTNLHFFRRWIISVASRFSARALLFVMGFHFTKEVIVEPKDSKDAGSSKKIPSVSVPRSLATCVVSNHVSYIDILYYVYAYPRGVPSFVAKKSVTGVPLVGFISKCFGCIYVERESKGRGEPGVAEVIVERMKTSSKDASAPLVLLFPEGTTSNGQFVLPFRTGAFLAGTAVQPILLRYGGPFFDPAWESMGGVRHLILLLCQPWHSLEVTRLPVYEPSDEESKDPKLYSKNVRNLMAAKGGLRLSPLTLYDKRVYHARLQGREPPPPPNSKTE